MSHTYEKISGNKVKLTFTIPAEQFDEAMRKAYLKLRNRINVPGFRKGKAPRKIIETMYGEGVFYDDAFELIFPDAYQEAVKEYDLHPVDRPDVDVDEIGAGQDLKFHLEVFVRPDVTLGEYKGLTVEIDQQKLTDEMVDARISQDQDKASRTLDVDDRPVQNGDTVNLDYAGTVDGVAFAGGTAQNQTLVIGSHQFIDGFEDQMIGMAIGEEKDLQVKFPDEYHAEELKGKDAVFHVKVNGIQVTEKPALDDDFAADISEYNTFDEYKASIVKELTDRINKNNDIAAENALVEKAAENATVDIPQAMIDDEAEYMVREMAMRMQYQGMRLEDYMKYTGQTMDDLKAMYRPEAGKRVKNQLVIDAIIKAEKLEPGEAEIEKAIADQAESVGQEVETFKKNLTDEQKEYLKGNASIRMALDLLKKDAKIEEKKAEAPAEEKPAKKPAAKKAAKKADAEAEVPAEEKAEKPAKKPAAKKAVKEEAPAEEKAEKPAKKPAAKKTAKKTEE
ncbi:MAG: trigger factor [Clostridiales bacterium]|nr:trigger factor [Clostridiales bacterium]